MLRFRSILGQLPNSCITRVDFAPFSAFAASNFTSRANSNIFQFSKFSPSLNLTSSNGSNVKVTTRSISTSKSLLQALDNASNDSSSNPIVDLNEDLIITKSCVNRIKHLQAAANDIKLGLRISVEGGGCSGFKYVFKMDNLEETASSDDRIFARNGTKVCVDSASLDLIKGSTIDYQQEMIRSAFAVVNNPQSESACGCGSSFAVKNFSSNPAID